MKATDGADGCFPNRPAPQFRVRRIPGGGVSREPLSSPPHRPPGSGHWYFRRPARSCTGGPQQAPRDEVPPRRHSADGGSHDGRWHARPSSAVTRHHLTPSPPHARSPLGAGAQVAAAPSRRPGPCRPALPRPFRRRVTAQPIWRPPCDHAPSSTRRSACRRPATLLPGEGFRRPAHGIAAPQHQTARTLRRVDRQHHHRRGPARGPDPAPRLNSRGRDILERKSPFSARCSVHRV